MAKLILPNGEERVIPHGQTVAQAIEDADAKLAKKTLACRVDGELSRTDVQPAAGATVTPVLRDTDDGLEVMRHSAAHVMAAAVKRIFGPEVKLGIGPSIKDGFYYDFDMPHRLVPEDLERIQKEMEAIIKAAHPFQRGEMTKEAAIAEAKAQGETYKAELIADLDSDIITTYTSGDFTDVCRGPHLRHTGEVGPVKLLNIAGAYWRGSEKNPMLQRIYGAAFWDQKGLKKHLEFLEEVKNRDHRLLGKDLAIYGMDDEIGAGLILWYPKGATIRRIIEDFWHKEHAKRGYQPVYTPHIASERTYERSGHLENYSDFMYGPLVIEDFPYRLKPMNCPGHIKIFQARQKSYRDLPVRFCELGTVYRFERSGTLHGLLRVRGFTQDDAHIFCEPEQLAQELTRVLELAEYMMEAFGFQYHPWLATRPEKSLGTDEEWDRSTQALIEALKARKMTYEVEEGGGAFYGPKIDIKVKDALGRPWQCTTVQFDFNMSERFGITYVGEDNRQHRPYMVHRALLGSMERFLGVLIEHYGGAFPVWLSPTQARVLPVADRHRAYAQSVGDRLKASGLRAEVDLRSEKVGFKIRDAEMQKIPYILVVGDKETAAGAVSVRQRGGQDRGVMPLADLIQALAAENAPQAA